jgi:hypothetical protein
MQELTGDDACLLSFLREHGKAKGRSIRKSVMEVLLDHTRSLLEAEIKVDPSPSNESQTWHEAMNFLRRNMEVLYDKVSTRRQWYQHVYTTIRGWMREWQCHPEPGQKNSYLTTMYQQLSLSHEDQKTFQEAQWKNCVDQNMSPRYFPVSTLIELGHLQGLALEPNHWPMLACSLMLALGTRAMELFALSSFEVYEDSSFTNVIRISHLAKKGKDTDSSSVRPVLFLPAAQVASLVQRLRVWVRQLFRTVLMEDGSERYLNPLILAQFNVFIGTKLENCTSHDLRRLYGVLSYQTWVPDTNLNLWLNRVLGHSVDSIQSSFHYSMFRIKLDQSDWKSHVECPAPSPLPAPSPPQECPAPSSPPPPSAPLSFPTVHRKMTSEERWQTIRQAIQIMQDHHIPVSAKKLQVYCKMSATWAAEAMQWYWANVK